MIFSGRERERISPHSGFYGGIRSFAAIKFWRQRFISKFILLYFLFGCKKKLFSEALLKAIRIMKSHVLGDENSPCVGKGIDKSHAFLKTQGECSGAQCVAIGASGAYDADGDETVIEASSRFWVKDMVISFAVTLKPALINAACYNAHIGDRNGVYNLI